MTNTTTSTVLSPGVPVAGQVRVQYEAGSFLAFFDELGQCLGRKPWAETGIPDDADYVAFLLARYGILATAKRVLIDGDQDADPEVIERREYQAIQEAASAWKARWPGHCAHCEGAGGTHSPATRWEPEDYTQCAACVEEAKCARCGEEYALTEDGDGPCRVCGWNFDDACPRH